MRSHDDFQRKLRVGRVEGNEQTDVSVHRDADQDAAHHVILGEFRVVFATVGMLVVTRPTRFCDGTVGIDRDEVFLIAERFLAVKVFTGLAAMNFNASPSKSVFDLFCSLSGHSLRSA